MAIHRPDGFERKGKYTYIALEDDEYRALKLVATANGETLAELLGRLARSELQRDRKKD